MSKRLLAVAAPFALALAAPGSALAAINESYRPQDEFKLEPWFSIGPIEFNKAVMYVIIAVAVSPASPAPRPSPSSCCQRSSRAP